MEENQQIIFMVVIIFLGVISTVVYYFARYYFRTHELDDEVVSSLKEKAELVSGKKSLSEELDSAAEPVPVVATKDLRSALKNTKTSLLGRMTEVFSSQESLSEEDLEQLEEILYTSDLGPLTVQRLMEAVSESLTSSEKASFESLRKALKSEISVIFESVRESESTVKDPVARLICKERPCVWMVVGVNGVGKTTTIGKLAHRASQLGHKTMVVAGDTFRAAAGDQLKVWSERADVEIFNPDGVTDPSAVAFDACQSAKSKGIDLVIVDTAGRLHTQDHLMGELQKMKRVIQKVFPEAPHETLLVLDSNSGQNALMQARSFHQALSLSGVILTKLDGTAKGGVAVGLTNELQLPIRMIGVGEGAEDLREFNPKEFIDSIL